MTSALDSELRRLVNQLAGTEDGLRGMVSYAMGWTGEGAGAATVGKRIRPLLCLLTAGAAGADWRAALPEACAVEFIHSFSLVHDDIQDQSMLRRGRPAVWKQYGLAHAINAGDAIFALAFSALAESRSVSAVEASQVLSHACLRLTAGQYLDMVYAQAENIQSGEYQEMIAGKTAALIAAACQLGAIAAGAPAGEKQAFGDFGLGLGMAFQVQDDYLGIWGDPGQTGKSAGSDLLLRKKSLPIVNGLANSAAFRGLLGEEPKPEALPALMAELESCGAKEFTMAQGAEWTTRAFTALHSLPSRNDCGAALEELAQSLLRRAR